MCDRKREGISKLKTLNFQIGDVVFECERTTFKREESPRGVRAYVGKDWTVKIES